MELDQSKADPKEETKGFEPKILQKGELISFAFDVGFAIVIPLVLLAGGGRLLDKYFETSPYLMIAGLLLSLVTTSIAVYRKTKTFL